MSASVQVDVLVVGAGISGIGAAYYLQERCPHLSFTILEGRAAIGGTWDLFRYPGIRSDSDMFTLGYTFRPWTDRKAIAGADAILRYLNETIDEYGFRDRIRFQHRVVSAAWSTSESVWAVSIRRDDTDEDIEIRCNFLFMCSGYYNYEQGYEPQFKGRERFRGRIVHPQQWTDDIDYVDKKVVVIGSGATAVTLIPAIANDAAHVTMLQRSPTYIVAGPSEDRIANWLRDRLPIQTAYRISRWKNVLTSQFYFNLSKRAPTFVRRAIRKGQREALGPDYDIDQHLTPRYNPWDQRVCLTPDGDFFDALKAGRAQIVTDTIETFTETGLKLDSGAELEADLIITATGLNMLFLAGIPLTVDGDPVVLSDTMSYKAMMFSDVPNLALSSGYTNASWTLKCDLTGEYICRLLNHMSERRYKKCVPRNDGAVRIDEPFEGFRPGYIQRAISQMPRQGSKAPWRMYQNYFLDLLAIRYGRVADNEMEFS